MLPHLELLRLLAAGPALSISLVLASHAQSAPAHRASAAELQSELNGIEADIKRDQPRPAVTTRSAAAHPAATPRPVQSVAQPAAATVASPAASGAAARALRVVGFMAVYPLSEADKQAVQTMVTRNYAKYPSYFATIDKVYQNIQQCSSDRWYSAQLRESMWQGIGQHPGSDMLLNVIYKYNPIIAQAGGKTLTKLAVQDMLAAQALVGRASGVSDPNDHRSAATVITQACQQLARTFASQPAAEQEALVHGESRYEALKKIIQTGSPARARTVATVRQQVHAVADIPKVTRQLEVQGATYARQQTSNQNVVNEQLRTAIVGYGTLSAFPGWGN